MLKKFAIQDYIKTITSISLNDKKDIVKLSEVAKKLSITNAAVSDMVKKLVKDGLIINHAYKGLELTDQGQKMGRQLIRHHRLWEVFLSNVLGLSWDEIHEEAEHLEHAASVSLMDRIDAYLNYPAVDPHGNPIPDKEGHIVVSDHEVLLSECAENECVNISRFVGMDAAYLEHIASIGLTVGRDIQIIKKITFD